MVNCLVMEKIHVLMGPAQLKHTWFQHQWYCLSPCWGNSALRWADGPRTQLCVYHCVLKFKA